MKRRIILLPSLIILLLGGPRQLFAWDGAFFDLFQVPFSAREAALGGVHAAQADDVSTLVSNPAGFRSAGPDVSFGTATLSIYDSAPSLIDQIVTGQLNTTPSEQRSMVNLLGPLLFAYVGNGLGFGVFTDSDVRTVTTGTTSSSVLTENLVLIPGYAFRIPLPDEWQSTLDIGFSLPFFLAARSFTGRDIRDLFTSSMTPTELVIDQPFYIGAGVGAEIGILYTWNGMFSVGIAARNLAITTWATYPTLRSYFAGDSPVNKIVPLPMDISVGIRWSPPIKMLIRSVDGLSLMADYSNIFDFAIYPAGATNPLLHFGIGIEITLLKVVKLRAGFYQLLPSGGLSLDLSLFTLDLAVFGRELSTQPWTDPVYGFMAGIRFRA